MTVKAGQKCTAIRRAIVPSRRRPTPSSRRSRPARQGHRRQPAPTRTSAWARWSSLDQREEVRKAVQSLRASAEIVSATPTTSTWSTPTPSAARSCRPSCCARHRGAVEPHDVEPFGPVSTVITYDALDEAVELAARGRGSLVGVRGHPRPRRRAHRGARPRAVARPHPRARPRRRRRVHRPRLAAADARARRPRPRRRRRGARRHPRRPAPHAAHRDPGLARHADRGHRALDDRLARAPKTRVHPFRKSLADLRDRRHDRLGSRARSPSRTSSTSRSSPATRSTPTPTRRRPRRTRCSAASSPTATSSSRWPPVCSSTPTRDRCSPTSASTTCASSRRSRPATRSR